MRRAPQYYSGTHVGKHVTQYQDVARYGNGVIPGVRDKAARRIIRKALKKRFSSIERALDLPRAMQAQAREIARDVGKSTKWARRLYDKELKIHQPVFSLTKKQRRAIRSEARKRKRKGEPDAIAQLVEKMAKEKAVAEGTA